MAGENFVLDFKFGGNAEFLVRLESLMRRVDRMFESTAEDIEDTTKATNELNKAAQNATPGIEKMSGGLSRLAGALKSVAASYLGLQGIRKVWDFGNESIDLYNLQLRQERQLQTVLNNKGLGDEFEGIRQHAANIQGRTIYGDEAMIAGAGELATYVQSGESMKRMMDLLANYAAGMTGGGEVTPQQMVDLATGLGKAFDGTYDAMRKKGFDVSGLQKITRAVELQEQMAKGEGPKKLSSDDREALKFLRDNKGKSIEDLKIEALEEALADWKGLSETFAQTDEGKIIQIKNAIGDMKEDLGKTLLPVVANIMGNVKDNLPKIQKMMDSLGHVFIAIGDALSSHMDQFIMVGVALSKVVSFVAEFPALSASAVMGITAIKNGFLETAFAAEGLEGKLQKTNAELLRMNKNSAMLIGGAGIAAGAMSFSAGSSESENAASGLKGMAMAAAFGASQFGAMGAAIGAASVALGGLISGVYQLWQASKDSDKTVSEIKEREKDMETLIRLRKEMKDGTNAAASVNYMRELMRVESKWGSLDGSYFKEGFEGAYTGIAEARNGTPYVKVNSDNKVSQTVNMETSISEAFAMMRTTLREFVQDTIKTEDIFKGVELGQ